MFALSMLVLIFGLIATAVDLAELYAARVRFYDAAEQAALAGASQVTVCQPATAGCGEGAQSGRAPQLEAGYQAACRAAGDAFSAVSGSTRCTAVGADTVEATVTARVAVTIPLPGMGDTFTVSANYAAVPVLGGQRPAA
jgi:Putative Flp pilus-assembly TadE/G-like